MVLTDTIVGFIFIIHLFAHPVPPWMMAGKLTRVTPCFLCWFNQIKPRNAKNRRTLNRAAPFRSFFAKKKKKERARPRYFRHPSTPFELSSIVDLNRNVSSSSFFFIFLKHRKINWRITKNFDVFEYLCRYF